MDLVLQHWPQVIAAYTIYLVAVISPGPAVLAIISASITGGRRTGLIVFSSYALLFSTSRALAAYTVARRWIDGAMAALFCAAGIKLLTVQI